MIPQEIIVPIALILDIFGTVIIVLGALLAVASIIKIEVSKIDKFHRYENAKRVFVQKIIFGLDFLISGDILRTATMPELNELIRLVLIVGIRTVLSYSLGKEVHLHRE